MINQEPPIFQDDDTDDIPVVSVAEVEPVDSLQSPPPYHELRHFKHFLKASWLGICFCALAVACLVASLTLQLTTRTPDLSEDALLLLGLVLLPIGCIMIYREQWRWKHEPLTCDPQTGMLEVHQAENRWLFIRGSAADPYYLKDYTLYTPPKGWLELFFFRRSQTVELRGDQTIELTDVLDVDRIVAIVRYRGSLDAIEAQREDAAANTLDEILVVVQEMRDLVRTLVRPSES